MFLVALGVWSKKLFESNLCILYFWYVIPLESYVYELSRSVNNHIVNIHCLKLSVQRPGDVG